MSSSTRHLVFLAALAALVLSGLGMGGVAVTLRYLSFARQEAALLDRPVEDLPAMAAFLTAQSAKAAQPLRPTRPPRFRQSRL